MLFLAHPASVAFHLIIATHSLGCCCATALTRSCQ